MRPGPGFLSPSVALRQPEHLARINRRLQNAEVRLEQGLTTAKETDLGFVPLTANLAPPPGGGG